SIKYMNMNIKKMWSRHMVFKWTQRKTLISFLFNSNKKFSKIVQGTDFFL
ncbi:unnamed protein product, partial [Rotaria socialis]